jgi:L-alanine-DL-glutamate epimerase-like enolase superfamily enzyme
LIIFRQHNYKNYINFCKDADVKLARIMQIGIETFTVHKRFPLTISRGTTSQTTNIWVRVEQQGIEGWGEASPFSITKQTLDGVSPTRQSPELLLEALQVVVPSLEAFSPWERQKIERVLAETEVPSAAWAAIDLALHDWLGKRAGMSLWRLWGLNRRRIVPTSVTVGINSPEGARQRVRDWLPLTGGGVLKIKLGSPDGIAADQQMLLAVRDEAPEAQLSVDANGGWSLDEAAKMCDWLATQGVKHVEQPLATGQEDYLPILYERSPLPIFVDESCFKSCDIPKLADRVHGINIKLMKSGGLAEAMRMVHTARACGLQVMFGCYSDSTLANTAISHLSPLADYLDLDSHLNLVDDPFTGATVQDGRLIPNELPGLGVQCRASDA